MEGAFICEIYTPTGMSRKHLGLDVAVMLKVSWSEALPNSDYLNLSRYLSFSALNKRLFQKLSIFYWHFIGILGKLWTP